MKSFHKILILVLLLGVGTKQAAASPITDSLHAEYLAATSDSAKAKQLLLLVEQLFWQHKDSANQMCNDAIKLSTRSGYTVGLVDAYNWLGYFAESDRNTKEAIEYYRAAVEFGRGSSAKKQTAYSLNKLGYLYNKTGELIRAFDLLNEALAMREEIGFRQGEAETLGILAHMYGQQRDTIQAINTYHKSNEIYYEIDNLEGVSSNLNSIAILYGRQNKLDSAMLTYRKSLALKRDLGITRGVAAIMHNLGTLYDRKDQRDSAYYYLNRSLVMHDSLSDKGGIISSLRHIADLDLKSGKIKAAQEKAERAYQMALEIDHPRKIRNCTEILYKIYKEQGKHKLALEMFTTHIRIKEQLLNEETQEAAMRNRLDREYERQKMAAQLEFDRQKHALDVQVAEKNARIESDANFRLALYAGIGLLLILAGAIYRSYRQKKQDSEVISRQKKKVEQQKELVEEKNQEIIDSITYAKRLQDAILPPLRLVKEHLPNSFIYYKPKDIVAGDFYWMSTSDEHVFFAAADCTGHGVPGAMVSVVCANALDRAVNEFQLTEPGQILDKVRELVVTTFAKSEEEVKDGMDIALVRIEREEEVRDPSLSSSSSRLKYAGANNALYIVRANGGNPELEEIKATKQAVGSVDQPKPFETHIVELNAGDTIYLFSDGFADQFGGPKGKKFKYRPFKQLLTSMHDKPMEHQHDALMQAFIDWKENLEQVDDVCVMGVRV